MRFGRGKGHVAHKNLAVSGSLEGETLGSRGASIQGGAPDSWNGRIRHLTLPVSPPLPSSRWPPESWENAAVDLFLLNFLPLAKWARLGMPFQVLNINIAIRVRYTFLVDAILFPSLQDKSHPDGEFAPSQLTHVVLICLCLDGSWML